MARGGKSAWGGSRMSKQDRTVFDWASRKSGGQGAAQMGREQAYDAYERQNDDRATGPRTKTDSRAAERGARQRTKDRNRKVYGNASQGPTGADLKPLPAGKAVGGRAGPRKNRRSTGRSAARRRSRR